MTKPSRFKWFMTSPESIRLAVLPHVRFSLSLRNVGEALHERGVEISHLTLRAYLILVDRPNSTRTDGLDVVPLKEAFR